MKIVFLLFLVFTVHGSRIHPYHVPDQELEHWRVESRVGDECKCMCEGGLQGKLCCPCPGECKCGTCFYGKLSCCKTCSCFPGDEMVTLDDGSDVLMKNLKAGEKIKTVSDGHVIYTEVKSFLKRQPTKMSMYLEIHTSTGPRLTLSDRHLVFVASDNVTANMKPRFAVSVKEGDYLFTTGQCGEALCPALVTRIETVLKEGAYVPLTDEGTLVVSGVFASCYSSIDHDIAHLFTTPFRWFPWLLSQWQEDGYSPAVHWMKQFGHAVLPNSLQFDQSEARIEL